MTRIFMALMLFALFASTAQARQHATEPTFDRHNPSGGFSHDAAPQRLAGVKQMRRKHQPRYQRDKVPRHYASRRSHPVKAGDHVLTAGTGAKASVSMVAKPHFRCLIDKLEAVGYRIDFMGGYASRGNSSAHPTGNALDINQTGRNIVTRRFPGNVTEMASDCGLMHGATWSHPDTGHFEMPKKYGYVYTGRRYALRRHRHYAAAR